MDTNSHGVDLGWSEDCAARAVAAANLAAIRSGNDRRGANQREGVLL